jgi:hypothetical protein
MPKFNVTLSQKLDDGDTALVEEYRDCQEDEVPDVISNYHARAASHSYVKSYTAVVEIKAD